MAHPFFDAIAFPWHRREAQELHAVLIRAITNPNEINLYYQQSGGALPPLTLNQPPQLVWREALENVARAGAMEALCDVLLTQAQYSGNERYRQAVEAVKNAAETVKLPFVPNSVVVLDRADLQDKLEDVESVGAPARVLLVRGFPKSGSSRARFLFEWAAMRRGAKFVYLFEGNVATADDVAEQLFSALEARDRIPDRGRGTSSAWYRAVWISLQEVAAQKKQRLWIAIEAPLLDPEIRELVEQLARNMANPLFGDWFRLMLIDYAEGDVPTNWEHDFWGEDRTSEDDIQEVHVAEFLRSWASHHERQLLDDDVSAVAGAIVAKVNAPPPPGVAAPPRLARLHDTLMQTLRDLEQWSP
jgi:hypothetical protein